MFLKEKKNNNNTLLLRYTSWYLYHLYRNEPANNSCTDSFYYELYYIVAVAIKVEMFAASCRIRESL